MRLGVNECTYHNWETNKIEPIISMYPGIILFLGYYPFPEPQTLGERILAYRRKNGLSLFRMAMSVPCRPLPITKMAADNSKVPILARAIIMVSGNLPFATSDEYSDGAGHSS